MSKSNHYNNLRIDIQKLHLTPLTNTYQITRGNLYLTGLLIKSRFWSKLIDSGFIREWFEEFHKYWLEILGGRPLRFHDFFYLCSYYRTEFQDVEVNENNEMGTIRCGLDNNFLEAWQLPENIYLIFSAAYKYVLSPLSFYPFRKYMQKAKSILEYGCGVAPITYSAIKYGSFRDKQFTIADIPNFTFHYAKWRLIGLSKIKMIDIKPCETPHLRKDYDLIFLMTVMEHLPDPLQVLQNLHNSLQSGGYLIFDYILGEGKGLDTKQAIRERDAVLNFIRENFILESGALESSKSMGTTIVRKR